ncbi:MAG: 50S ribosome-binding GTPase [Planctomycetaceae bacterium]|jgi:tRNA modification GTPase|nr:50S ribosome-binding GTPase [Planctomycetaceae bacterium]
MSKVFLSRLTPAGRGGVATLWLSGLNAKDIFLSRFISASDSCRLASSPSRPYFGKLQLNNINQSEEIVARIIDSDNIEIHCHGGNMIFDAIKKSFAQDGVLFENNIENYDENYFDNHVEFTGKNSQRELALQLLPFAATERVAQILLDQYHGALERELGEIDKLTMMIDRNIELGKIQLDELQSQLQLRQNRLEENRLLGQHLIKPFRVVLTGKTNVGKSSLFNAILGYNRAITSPLSGTTRDVVIAQTAIDGFPVTIYDTAGIDAETEADKDEIECEGIRRSIEKISDADLVILVIDLTTPFKNLLAEINVTKNTLLCYNKTDLHVNKNIELPDGIYVSAKSGEGISELIERIARILIPTPPIQYEAVPLIDIKI